MIAKALHPGDALAQRDTVAELEKEFRRMLARGELVVREVGELEALGKVPRITFELVYPGVVLLPQDMQPVLERHGIEVFSTPHENGPELWTLRNAATAVFSGQGFDTFKQLKVFQQGMLRAAERGEFPVYDPITLSTRVGGDVIDCWELVSPEHVNDWLRKQDSPYSWMPRESEAPDREAPQPTRVPSELPTARTTTATTGNTTSRVQSAPASTAANVLVHRTKQRRDALTPVIEEAQSRCRNPADVAEVWGQLMVMAEQKAPPLRGATEDGIQYLKDGTASTLSRSALAKRIRRILG